MIADHIMIMVKPGKTQDDVERLANQFGGRIRRTVNAKTYLISFDSSKPEALDEAVSHFLAQKDTVQVSEPDYVYGLGE